MTRTVSFAHPSDLNNGPICGVLATAIATGVSFQTAFEYYKKKKSGKWKGALHTYEIRDGIEDFGGILEEVKLWKWNEKELPLREVAKKLGELYPNQLFIVFVRQHVVTVYNGNIIDQNERGSADTFWCRQRKVEYYGGIYRVTNAVVDDSQFVATSVRKPNLNKRSKLPEGSPYKNKVEGARAIFNGYEEKGYHPKQYIKWIISDFRTKLNMKNAAATTYFYKIAKEKGYDYSRWSY